MQLKSEEKCRDKEGVGRKIEPTLKKWYSPECGFAIVRRLSRRHLNNDFRDHYTKNSSVSLCASDVG